MHGMQTAEKLGSVPGLGGKHLNPSYCAITLLVAVGLGYLSDR